MPEPEEPVEAERPTPPAGGASQPAWFRVFFGLGSSPPKADVGDDRREKLAVAGAGIELAVGICLFAGIGYGLDHWLGTLPWGTVVGALLGFAAGLYLLIKSVSRLNRKP